MAETKQSRRLVLRNRTKSSSTFTKIKSSTNKSDRLVYGNEDNENDEMSTSPKAAFKAQSEFSLEDDLAIIRFLLESSRYLKAGRREIWLKMSSQKVTKHSWLTMKDRYKRVIQPVIDKYPIPEKDADKLRSSLNDRGKRSVKYELRSASSDENGIPVTENIGKQTDSDDDGSSLIKRHCQSDNGQNSRTPVEAQTLNSGSGTFDFATDVALKALPKYKRIKASNLQLNVVKLDNEKRNVKRKTVLKRDAENSRESEEASDADEKSRKLDDLRRRVTLLSDDVTSSESTDERDETQEKEGNVELISSLSRNRRTRKSKKSTESHLQQTDTSVSEDIFSAARTLRRSKVSSRLQQASKDNSESATTAASSDEHHQPAALPLEQGKSDVLGTNRIRNFIHSDLPGDDPIEVNNSEKTEDLTTVEHNMETEKNLLVCQNLMTWLNVSPEVFAQSVLMNSGHVDDGVHWLLFNKTASGDTLWNPKDDKDLLNGDEDVYKSLEERYGETLVLKRQQFLATNSSSLHV